MIKRWSLINKKSGNMRKMYATRSAARNSKRPTERIFDTVNETFVR